MDATITIAFPVHPAVFAVFMALLVLAFVYYAVKFVLSLATGG